MYLVVNPKVLQWGYQEVHEKEVINERHPSLVLLSLQPSLLLTALADFP